MDIMTKWLKVNKCIKCIKTGAYLQITKEI